MEWTAVVSLVCVCVAALVCIAGVFCPAYRDNWLQWAGLWCMALWGFSRIEVIAERGYTEPWNMLLHIGMACYGIGTAVKVHRHSRGCEAEDVEDLARARWRHVSGGRK